LLADWLDCERARVCELLGDRVANAGGKLDARAEHLVRVAQALDFVACAPLSPRGTVRGIAATLRARVAALEPAGSSPELTEAREFLGHCERILDWTQNG
jgi:hypothetical protein